MRWRINRANLADRTVRAAAADGLGDAVEFLLEEGNRTIPLEEGTLLRSGVASVDRHKLRGAISWDGPYAVRQHEDLTLRHDEGRRAKWAEAALKERGEDALQHIAKRVKAVLR